MSLVPEPGDLGPPSPIDAGNLVAGRYVAGERYAVRGDVHLHHGASEDGLVRIAAFRYRGAEPLPRFLELLRFDADEWKAVAPVENGRLPVVVPTLDIGRMPNTTTCYWIQDDPRGPSLGDRLEQNPKFTPDYAIRIARQIGDALRTVHGAGLVHGDLDPANIAMLSNFDLVRLAWGGLASRIESSGMDAGRGGSRTLAEVSPEVLQGRSPDPRSDLYALCALLYRMLAGQPAWLVRRKGPLPGITDDDPLPPLPEWVVSPLPEVLAVGLQRDPGRRPDSIADWLDHLDESAIRFRELPAAPGTWAPSATGGPEPTPPTLNRTLSPAHDVQTDWALSNTPASSSGRPVPTVLPHVRSVVPATRPEITSPSAPERTASGHPSGATCFATGSSGFTAGSSGFPASDPSPAPLDERDFFAPEPRSPFAPLVMLSAVGFGFLLLLAVVWWIRPGTTPVAADERPPPVVFQSAPTPEPAPPTALRMPVTVTLRTHPPGAQVLENGVVIGETPVEIPLTGGPADPPRSFQLRLHGYAPHTVSQSWSAMAVEHTVPLQRNTGSRVEPRPRLPIKEQR